MQAVGPAVTKVDTALVNLRSRALDIHARLVELRDSVGMLRDGVGPGRAAAWPIFLEKYDVLSKIFSQLTDELDRALTDVGLDSFVAIPRAVTDDPTFLPDLLRTKLDPNVEREYHELQKGYNPDKQDPNKPPVNVTIRMYNEFIDSALEDFQELRDKLAQPRPREPQPPPAPATVDGVLAAIANGTGLKQ